ncbi:MAG TPA: menaquinone biosynthesis decarboxylase [Bacteroidales bacterium]|nr:menaquinone biosynthesis decarboxylase [Bacteroidales bacterium]
MYQGLFSFIGDLEKKEELQRIKVFADPVLEIPEITDRVIKGGNGKALLFENNGTGFPVLINAYGSEKRMLMALGITDPDSAGEDIETLLNDLSSPRKGILEKLSSLPLLSKISGMMPAYSDRKGICQQVIHNDPDIGILPVLKCWPHDGGRFITLPMVHTKHPVTGQVNLGMYRMQVLDRNTTAMHWQRHKTGANHFEAWKAKGALMPVSVTLGGDPVYTYSATAPLPENINEYILAGFLRKKKVNLVKCITNDLYVPADADIVIEGYVDPSEELVFEGPFGDHTGFYSLADWYPKFHITCITHARNAVYPATIVGIPPQEDAWLAYASEKIFLSPVRLALAPEVRDFHMPVAGTAHNLMVVKIDKSYPGQGMKVISSLAGAGQMMFSKYIAVVSGDVDIRDYKSILRHIFSNTDFRSDILFSKGPLDVLDHSSDAFSFGGKAGIDATVKMKEEGQWGKNKSRENLVPLAEKMKKKGLITKFNSLSDEDIPLLIVATDQSVNHNRVSDLREYLKINLDGKALIITVDDTVDVNDLFVVAWQALSNTDPLRDHMFTGDSLFIDATIKAYRKGGFPREWPNVVCSDQGTIDIVNTKWKDMFTGDIIQSPSEKYMKLLMPGRDKIEDAS